MGFRPLDNDIEKELEKLTILECINTLGLLYEDPEKLPFIRLVLKNIVIEFIIKIGIIPVLEVIILNFTIHVYT